MNSFRPPTLCGMPVIENDACQPGAPLLYGDGFAVAVVMHPFDVIAIRHPRDPIARLQAVTQYIIDRAHRQLDSLARTYAKPNPPTYRARAWWNPEPGGAIITGEWHDEAARYALTGKLDPGPCQCDACTTSQTQHTTALAAEEGSDSRG